MKSLTITSLLLTAACGTTKPEPIKTTDLPVAGRAIRLVSKSPGPFRGKRTFDVAEVRDDEVRLRIPLGDHLDPGTWVRWETVLSWEDVGAAAGDDRYLGLPADWPGYAGE